MKKIITAINIITIILIVLSVMLAITSAQEYTFIKDTTNEVKISCETELGKVCETSVSCNMSLLYPNNSLLKDNVKMTNNGFFYNYTLLDTELSELGNYKARIQCCGNYCKTEEFSLLINRTGKNISIPTAIMYVAIMVFLLFLFVLMLITTYKIKWNDYDNNSPDPTRQEILQAHNIRYFKLLSGFGSYFLLLIIVSIAGDFSGSIDLPSIIYNTLHLIYVVMITLIYPIILITFILMIYLFITGKKLKEFIDRNMNLRY
jgi:hypothetical protein